MFQAVMITKDGTIIARGALPATRALENGTVMIKLCTRKRLEQHAQTDPEVYGSAEYSLNRKQKADGSWMTILERVQFHTDMAETGVENIPEGADGRISWGQQNVANTGLRARHELKKVALIEALKLALQALLPLITPSIEDLQQFPELLLLYNRSDPQALLEACQALLRPMRRSDIITLRSLRQQVLMRPNTLNETEWIKRLNQMNTTLASYSTDLECSPAEIRTEFLGP